MLAGEATTTVGAIASALEARFPHAWAEPWDRVGLIAGDPAALVTRALVTLDATAEAVERAHAVGAGVLVTHHPPFLDAPQRVVPASGSAGAFEACLRLGCALIAVHTNLDRAPEGADALPALLGLSIEGPLESGTEEVAVVVTYAPEADADRLVAAMSAAGAGRLGPYEGCAYLGDGAGVFRPLGGARPAVAPKPEGVAERRIEVVCPRDASAQVVEAARAAHPYEEPVVLSFSAERARGTVRLGRICRWSGGRTLGELAAHVASTLRTPVRVWGTAARRVETIAVANGSGGSLIRDALRAAADVLVTGEVRYHDALDAASAGLAVIEAGHDATEWPLAGVLARAVRDAVPGGFEVLTEEPRTAWTVVEGADDRG